MYDSTAATTQYTSTQNFTRALGRSQDKLLRPSGMTVSVMNNGSPQVEAQTTHTCRAHDSRLATVADASSGSFTYAYEPGAYGLVKSVAGPAHTVTNTYEANRDILAKKENKNGGTNLATVDYSSNAIGNREKTANGLLANLPATPNYVADAVNQYTKANGITLPVNGKRPTKHLWS